MIELYLNLWLMITSLTWLTFFVGYGVILKYSGKSTRLTRVLRKIFEYGIDLPCNYFLSIIPFFDLPAHRYELVTHRLTRYKTKNGKWWRYQIAVFICRQLNRVDKEHC